MKLNSKRLLLLLGFLVVGVGAGSAEMVTVDTEKFLVVDKDEFTLLRDTTSYYVDPANYVAPTSTNTATTKAVLLQKLYLAWFERDVKEAERKRLRNLWLQQIQDNGNLVQSYYHTKDENATLWKVLFAIGESTRAVTEAGGGQ